MEENHGLNKLKFIYEPTQILHIVRVSIVLLFACNIFSANMALAHSLQPIPEITSIMGPCQKERASNMEKDLRNEPY